MCCKAVLTSPLVHTYRELAVCNTLFTPPRSGVVAGAGGTKTMACCTPRTVIALLLVAASSAQVIDCPAGFTSSRWTTYYSYPCCCKGNPNYSPQCDTTECDDYDGCKWSGDFAYIDHKSYDWVASHSIVAFFALKDNRKYANKNLMVLDTHSGKNFTVLVGDTCGDDDCGGCCTKGAEGAGGFLIDMEVETLARHYPKTDVDSGVATTPRSAICWKDLSADPTPSEPAPAPATHDSTPEPNSTRL